MIAGERRWRAAERAGLSTVAAIIHDEPLSAGDLLAIQVTENAYREDLKPVEQARAYKRLMDIHGWSVTELAHEVGVSQASASRALALLVLPEVVQAQVEVGALAPSIAYEVSQLDDPEAQAEIAERAVAGQVRRDEVRQVVRRKRGESATERHQMRVGDCVITIKGPGVNDPETVRERLTQALEQLKIRRAG